MLIGQRQIVEQHFLKHGCCFGAWRFAVELLLPSSNVYRVSVIQNRAVYILPFATAALPLISLKARFKYCSTPMAKLRRQTGKPRAEPIGHASLVCRHYQSWSSPQRLERAMYVFAYGRFCNSSNLRCKFYRFPPDINHLDCGSYYADKLLCSNYLMIAEMLTLNTITDNEAGDLVKYRSKWTGNDLHRAAIFDDL